MKKIKFTKESLIDFIKQNYVYFDRQDAEIFLYLANKVIEEKLEKYRVLSLYDVAKIIFEEAPSYWNAYKFEDFEFEYDCYYNGYILMPQAKYKPIAMVERIDNIDYQGLNRKWLYRFKLEDTVNIKGV